MVCKQNTGMDQQCEPLEARNLLHFSRPTSWGRKSQGSGHAHSLAAFLERRRWTHILFSNVHRPEEWLLFWTNLPVPKLKTTKMCILCLQMVNFYKFRHAGVQKSVIYTSGWIFPKKICFCKIQRLLHCLQTGQTELLHGCKDRFQVQAAKLDRQ